SVPAAANSTKRAIGKEIALGDVDGPLRDMQGAAESLTRYASVTAISTLTTRANFGGGWRSTVQIGSANSANSTGAAISGRGAILLKRDGSQIDVRSLIVDRGACGTSGCAAISTSAPCAGE